MAMDKKKLINEALSLSPAERTLLIDLMVQSLDQPDPMIDKEWLQESHERLKAFHEGELESISFEEIKTRYT